MKGHVTRAFILILTCLVPTISFGKSNFGLSGDTCSVQLFFPLDYQTFQRDRNNTADLPVRGYCSCTGDAVEASWNEGPFVIIDSVITDNYFEGLLPSCTAGQGSLIVRCVSSPDCLAQSNFVGVGEVFVIAGQSNASGRAHRLNRYDHQTLRATVFSGTGNWHNANDPLHTQDQKTKGSVWPLLATHIMEDQNVPVAFIATAMGGTGLVANGHWNPPNGSRYRNMVELVGRSEVNAVRSVLFFQGERDISHGIPEQEYFTELLNLARVTRDTLPGRPIMLVGQTGFYGPKGNASHDIDAIRFAQARAWDSLDYIFPGPVTFDLSPLADGIHFTEDNHIRILAERWWASIRSAIYGSGQRRGPRGTKAYLMPDKQTVAVLFKHEASSMESDDPARGFQVVDGSSDVPVIAAEIREPDTVFLHTDRALQADEVRVNYGSGNRPGRLYAAGNIPLPAEPFTGMPVFPMLQIPSITTETEVKKPPTRKEKREIRRANRSGRNR